MCNDGTPPLKGQQQFRHRNARMLHHATCPHARSSCGIWVEEYITQCRADGQLRWRCRRPPRARSTVPKAPDATTKVHSAAQAKVHLGAGLALAGPTFQSKCVCFSPACLASKAAATFAPWLKPTAAKKGPCSLTSLTVSCEQALVMRSPAQT